MYKLIILVEPQDDWFRFERDWPRFLALAESMPGLKSESTSRIERQLHGDIHCTLIHELFFESKDSLTSAMSSPEGQAAGNALQAITGGKVTLLFAEHRADDLDSILRYQQGSDEEADTLMKTPIDLQDYMDHHGISGEIVYLDVPTPTVTHAAEAVGTDPDLILKSVLFIADGEPIFALTCGQENVDPRTIATLLGIGRKRVKLANAAQVLEMTGYPVGAVPPFGHVRPIRVLIDPGVFEHEEVFAGGGAMNTLVRVAPNDILRTTDAKIIKLRQPSD